MIELPDKSASSKGFRFWRKSLWTTVFFTFVIPSNFSHAQTELPSKLDGFIKRLESQTAHFQGGAIAILHKGQLVYKVTFGNRKDNDGPVTSSTLFPLASVSKAVSAMAISLLVEKGQLRLDETYKLPYLKNPVSLKNILSHTTGYKFTGNQEIEEGLGRHKLLEKLKIQKPQCKPGECYSYSNTTFSLVEEALNTKKLSLKSAISGLRSALKTNGIQLVPISSNFENAYPHKKNKEGDLKSLPFPPYYPKAAPAAAGVFASLDAMIEVFKLSFGYRSDIISQKTLDVMHKPIIKNRDIDNWGMQWPCDLKQIESSYALGWRILKANPEKYLVFHGGSIAGISTFIGFIPSEEFGIIILLNQGPRNAPEIGVNFWGEFFEHSKS